ncbi:MAG TPA: hypothetical protein VHO46_11515 [Bacteroidales bacterium]|nr:hypothetical protein [Bacteroidales bacterium]
MRTRSYEEKQLSKKIFEIENIAAEISIELDHIFRELDRKGKWDEFMLNLDKVKPKKKYSMAEVSPENYYESLHFAFDMLSKTDEFKAAVELAATEADLLKGRGINEIALSEELNDFLKTIGVSIDPGISNAPPIKNDKYCDRICLFNLKSARILRFMEKSLCTLKESKTYIFMKYC